MSAGDKFDELSGKAKEGAGKLTGDEDLEGEGKIEQAKAKAKESVEEVKDAAESAKNAAKGMFGTDR
ncbi:CsbD family protein [Haloechinothrix sp. LS1_15]|uniref:CsbD family protein n=1 Tax=Haloechinothrix sp. LS1_15 TaxID=2652248 RepID=UPI00294B8B4A|nr:CsbD family protein [Haloechinothrix sp. LS1_15]